jgi:hypothetical protein
MDMHGSLCQGIDKPIQKVDTKHINENVKDQRDNGFRVVVPSAEL